MLCLKQYFIDIGILPLKMKGGLREIFIFTSFRAKELKPPKGIIEQCNLFPKFKNSFPSFRLISEAV